MGDKHVVDVVVPLDIEFYEKLSNKSGGDDKEVPEKIIEIIAKDLTTYKLAEGFTYNLNDMKVLSPKGNLLVLTKKEELIINLLLSKPNETIEIDKFFEIIWKGKSSNSILCSLRNLIKSIREKTTYSLIKNISGKGYMIEIN